MAGLRGALDGNDGVGGDGGVGDGDGGVCRQ